MRNKVKEKLKQGQIVFGHMVFEFFSPGIAQILSEAGFEFVIFDSEHARFGIESLAHLLAWSKSAEIVRLVRVPDLEYHFMARALDSGAQGLMIPRVETRDQVERIIKYSKYAPMGNRGTAFGIAHDDYRSGDIVKTMQDANEQTLIIILLESALAIENIEELLSVQGVDVAWVGHYDLTLSMGIPGQFEHPRFLDAVDRVIEACAKYGVAPGILPADVDTAIEWIRRGFRMIAYSTDIRLYMNAGREALQRIRREIGKT